MKTKVERLSNRHPKVILLFDDEENVSGAKQILAEHVENFRAMPINNQTAELLVEIAPDVILFGLNHINESINYYCQLIEDHEYKHQHYAVLLCKNKESAIAFNCCTHKLFNNYFVYQPLYEKFRLLMIVQTGLLACESQNQVITIQDDTFEKLNNELKTLIDESSEQKQQLLSKLNQSKTQMDNIVLPKNSLVPPINADDLIAQITHDHVTPVLNILEDDIKRCLEQLIGKLQNQHEQTKVHIESANHQDIKAPDQSEPLQVFEKKTIGSEEEPPKQFANKYLEQLYYQEQADKQGEKELTTHESPSTNKPSNNDLAELSAEVNRVINTYEEQIKNTTLVKSKVLIVEDNELYREMLAKILQDKGFDITTASDGIKALKQIQKERFDLIIMDLFMPHLDGLNTTKKIRQLSNGIETPVIALTGNKNKEYAKQWINYGLKGYILKPSTKNEILSVVNSVLTSVKAASQ